MDVIIYNALMMHMFRSLKKRDLISYLSIFELC